MASAAPAASRGVSHKLSAASSTALRGARRPVCGCNMPTTGPGGATRSSTPLCRALAPLPATPAPAPRRRQPHHQQQHRRRGGALVALGAAAPGGPQQQQQQPQDQQQQEERPVVYNTEFGYSRKDVLIIIVGLIGLGVVMYEGLQAMGMEAGIAGNWVQATIFLGICVGWVSTYLWRVANKKMTYAQQLQMYEAAVMEKRLEEMTEAELAQLLGEVEADKARLAAAKQAALAAQQQQQQQEGRQG